MPAVLAADVAVAAHSVTGGAVDAVDADDDNDDGSDDDDDDGREEVDESGLLSAATALCGAYCI